MYSIDRMKEDVNRIEAMFKVLGEFADGRVFAVNEIPEDRRKGYFRGRWDWCSVDFTGASMTAVCRRGLAEVVKTEDDIYKCNDKKYVVTRTLYRCTGIAPSEYRATLATLVGRAIRTA
jgi:hypothetical protein